jgi:uncharacterized protein (UPF0276 family)
MLSNSELACPHIGVGLRHPHYEQAITEPKPVGPKAVDFLEIHAENFFMPGGASLAVLDQVAERYDMSIHGTAMSLGSLSGIDPQHLAKFKELTERINPILVSDHACFAQAQLDHGPVHLNSLIPIAFNETSLAALVRNIDQVQEALNRPIMIENLSAYLALPGNTFSETEFLVEVCRRSGCKLLLDLNNLVVNAINAQVEEIRESVTQFLSAIPPELVGEFHLAGCTPVEPGEIMIDDHSQPVPEPVWEAYGDALTLMGSKPTLIEWDTALPSWDTLLAEAEKARTMVNKMLLQTRSA